MPTWVSDSRFAGYLGPTSAPPPDDDPLADILHEAIAGITGMPPVMVRASWSTEPGNQPDILVNWCGFGINAESFDWMPAIEHVDEGDGHDVLIRNLEDTVHVTFYGPNAQGNASLLRDGLFIDQNMASFRALSMAVVEVSDFTLAPEQFRENRWYNRVDLDFTIRRQITRTYPVLTLLRAEGIVVANDPGERIVTDDWDTEKQI